MQDMSFTRYNKQLTYPCVYKHINCLTIEDDPRHEKQTIIGYFNMHSYILQHKTRKFIIYI